MMNNLLLKTSGFLADYLGEILPQLFDNWWEECVINNLSFQQRRLVSNRKIKKLNELDLAALLRILDKNWYNVSNELKLTIEDRNFVKEMQTVRNRWAHISSEGFSDDDIYRDLDTLERFARVINADAEFIAEIKNSKRELLSKSYSGDYENISHENEEETDIQTDKSKFLAGQLVVLKSNPSLIGAVVSVIESEPEDRIKVFINGETRTYYASQLQTEDSDDDQYRSLTIGKFHAYLTALQIQYPGLSTLYSLNAARVEFIPYQFRPVLKFIRSDRPRLLIADGVGVGKTIEAGLILRELQARRDVRSIMIICPRPLVTERKWELEMRRFEERFIHLDGKSLNYCIDEMDLEGEWPEQYKRAIVPYSLFDESLLFGSNGNGKKRFRRGLMDLDPPPRFDMVIVDEAHHIRNQDTYSHKAVKFFCDNAEAVVFLTATPIQLGNQDLFVLLNTLRPDLIIDRESFQHMAEPNPYINQAVEYARGQSDQWSREANGALKKASSTSWGQSILRHNPRFVDIQNRLSADEIKVEERIKLINDLEELHTFSGIINRTRRRDIGEFTIRKPETVIVEFTQEQEELHNELLQIQAEIFSILHGHMNVKFMMTTIRRQAASSLFGLIPFLEDILNRHIDELLWDEVDHAESAPDEETVHFLEPRIQRVLNKARNLDPKDPKLDALRKILKDKQELANNKVMLFSSFRHTLAYLNENLKKDGFRVAMVHGDTPEDERIDIRHRFQIDRKEKECIDVVLFSEIGSEGLDYQFCDCIVNYDLPWNPMKVEQRIGRIDRKGQKSETVAIFNLITPGTVDADIYERCLLRIGVFNKALGGSEEILGEVTREIRNIAENFSITDEERSKKLQQLADNKIRLIQEQEELEQKQMELFGIQLPKEQMQKEIDSASSYWLTPGSIARMVKSYLEKLLGSGQEYIIGEKPLKNLRISQESRSKLLKDFQKINRQKVSSYKTWEEWLKGADPHLPLTFESECASDNPKAAFITPLHPLAIQAANSVDAKKRAVTALKVKSDNIPDGNYKFAIYQWQFHGVRKDLNLKPVSDSDLVTDNLLNLLENATQDSLDKVENKDTKFWDSLDIKHHKLWTDARINHRQKTKEQVEFKRESLTTSHKARISLLEEQLEKATDKKIQKMRSSQIESAEADYTRRIQDLDIAIERAEITAEPVAYGILNVY